MTIKPVLCGVEQSSSSTYSDPSAETSVTIYDTLLHNTIPTTYLLHVAAPGIFDINDTQQHTAAHSSSQKRLTKHLTRGIILV